MIPRKYLISSFVLLVCGLGFSLWFSTEIELLVASRYSDRLSLNHTYILVLALFFVLVGTSWFFQKLQNPRMGIEKAAPDQENSIDHSIIENTPNGLCLIDPSGHILKANPAFCQLLEYSHEELKTCNLLELMESELSRGRNKTNGSMPYKKIAPHPLKIQKWKTKTNQILKAFTGISPLGHGDIPQYLCTVINAEKAFSEAHVDEEAQKKAEEQFRVQEKRLNRAQELGKVGDWEYDLVTTKVSWSNMVFQLFEIPSENKVINPYLFLHKISPAFSAALKKQLLQALELQRPFEMLQAVKLGQKEKFLSVKGMPHFDEDGHPLKISGTLQDVTSATLAARQIKEANTHLNFLSDNFPGVILQFSLDENNVPVPLLVSMRTNQLWGMSEEEVRANPGHILMKIPKRDLVQLRQTLGKSQEHMTKFFQAWRFGKKWHKGVGLPGRKENGKIVWNAFIYDVTDNMKAKKALMEQEKFQHILTQNASDAIVACDLNEQLVFANKTFKNWLDLGWDYKVSGLFDKDDCFYSIDERSHLKKEELSLGRALHEGKVRNQEFIIKLPNQPMRYVEANGEALYNEYSEKIGAVIVIRDITARVNRNIEISNSIIEARDEERTNLASELHDGILQSLAIVARNLKTLGLDNYGLVENEAYQKSLESLQTMIVQSRNMAHKIMPNSIRDFGLVQALKEVLDDLQPETKMNLTLNYNLQTRFCHKRELNTFRIIQEGIKNAITHSGGDSLHVAIDFKQDQAKIIIKDNGNGFPQVAKRSSGIGLLTMRDRVRKLDGTIKISSSSTGTTILLCIPL